MDENDRLQMYEAQAIALEKEQELEQKEKELEEARREIKRLRLINQQLNFRDVVAEIEQTFNARFLEMNQKFNIQLSKLQREINEKTEENVLFKEEYNKNNKDLAAESELKTKELMDISARLENVCSELALQEQQTATFNAKFLELNQKFEDFSLQLSKLQQTTDDKATGDLRIVENLNQKAVEIIQIKEENISLAARMNLNNDELTEESKDTKELFMKFSSRLDAIYSELNPHTSVILLGGWHSAIPSDSICMSNSKENKWINSHFKLPYRLSYHGSVILNGEIYIFGGWDGNERFKSTYKLGENGEWIKLADMNEERSGIERSSVVFEDEIWVFGGWDGTNKHKTVEKYNPKTNTWTMMPKMSQARYLSAVSIINEKFYVSGGFGGNWFFGEKYLNIIEVYDPEKKKWEIFSNMPLALSNHASIVDGTNLIIIGGRKSDDQPSAEVWKIDVIDSKKEWKKMPNLQKARMDHGAVQLEDGLMVIGGASNDIERIASVEIFDGQKWKEGPNLPEIRGSFPLILLTSKNKKSSFENSANSRK